MKSTRIKKKVVMPGTDFFHVQFEFPRVKSRQLFYTENSVEGSQFLHLLWAFCQDLELQVTLKVRKEPVLGQKKLPRTFDTNHHFEPHKIGF